MMMLGPRTSPLLRGGDPVPGDGEQITAVVRRLREIGETAGDTATLLGHIGWTGKAADAFAVRRHELLERLQTAQSAYTGAADVLRGWLGRLQELQAEATRIAAEAERLRQSAQAENPATVFATIGAAGPPGSAALQQRHDDVARRARVEAQRCAEQLAAAVSQVRRFQHSTWEHITSELLTASDVLGKISLALTILAVVTIPFPPAAAAFGIASKVAGGLKLGIDVVLAADGKKSWTTIGVDAIGFGLGVGGKGASGMTGLARTEAKLRTAAQAATDPAKAARFAQHADEAAAQLAGGFRSVLGRNVLHPIENGRDLARFKGVVKEAGLPKLPKIEHWIPAGHERLVATDLVIESVSKGITLGKNQDKIADGSEKIKSWLEQATARVSR